MKLSIPPYSPWVAFVTIVRKELVRFFRIWTQTFLPPAINQTLYFLVFGAFIGSQVADIGGISYMAFLVPGLVMMSVIMNAYNNVVSSFFGAKFQHQVEELMVSPTPAWIILSGYVMGGVLRGLITGLIVYGISLIFVAPTVVHPMMVFLFAFLTALVFSLGGFLNALFARNFDDVSFFLSFILTPLIYLGGVFYSIAMLPPFWQAVSKANPILYMIDGFRYGFYGLAEVSVGVSLLFLVGLSLGLFFLNWILLERGRGLRS